MSAVALPPLAASATRGLPALLHGRRRGHFARLAANGVAQAAGLVAIAWAIRGAVDADAGDAAAPLRAAAVGAVAAVGMAALRWRERVDAETLAQAYVYRVRIRLLAKLARVEPAILATRGHGGLLLRFAGDLSSLGLWVGRGLARLLVSGIVLAVVLALVATFHWALAATLGAGLVVAALAAGARTPGLDAGLRTLRTARARLVTRINATLNRLAEIDRAGGVAAETRLLGRRARRVRDAAIERAREVAAVDAIAEAGAFAIPVAVLVAAVALRPHGVTDGELAAVLGVALLVGAPLRELGRVFDYWRRAAVARAKLHEYLALPERRRRRGVAS